MVYTSPFSSKKSDIYFIKIKGALNKVCGGIIEKHEQLIKEIMENMEKGNLDNKDVFNKKITNYFLKQLISPSHFKFQEEYIGIFQKIVVVYTDLLVYIKKDIESTISNLKTYEKKEVLQIGLLLYKLSLWSSEEKNFCINLIQSLDFKLEYVVEMIIGYYENIQNLNEKEDEIITSLMNDYKKVMSNNQALRIQNIYEMIKGITNKKSKKGKQISESIFEMRSRKLWSIFIQMQHENKTIYDVKKLNTTYELQTLVKDINLKNIFSTYKNITAFSLFKNGSPEWSSHIGGGRFILKTENWEAIYQDIFEWLRKLDQDSSVVTALSIINGFRFKIKPVNNLYSIEIWFDKPQSIMKSSQYKMLLKSLETKLNKDIFGKSESHHSTIRVDYFNKDNKRKSNNKNDNRTSRNSHRDNRSSNNNHRSYNNHRDNRSSNNNHRDNRSSHRDNHNSYNNRKDNRSSNNNHRDNRSSNNNHRDNRKDNRSSNNNHRDNRKDNHNYYSNKRGVKNNSRFNPKSGNNDKRSCAGKKIQNSVFNESESNFDKYNYTKKDNLIKDLTKLV